MFLSRFAQATSTCTLNGQPASCKVAGGIVAGSLVFLLIILLFTILNLIFWIISLIHVIKHRDVEDRILWLVLILLVPLGAWVYFFFIRRKYNKSHLEQGPQPSAPTPNTSPQASSQNPNNEQIPPTAPIAQ